MTFPGKHFFKNIVERRALLYQLVRRDFERRFVGSAGGWLWSVIHPLVLLASWTFVFHICLRMPVPSGAGTDNYTLFLFCGYLPWMLFQDTVSRSTTSVLESSNLITKSIFPSEMVPVSVFCSSLVSHVITLIIAIVAAAIWGNGVSSGILWLPVYIFWLALMGIGVGWIFSSFQVYLRDTAQAVLVLLTLWFWATPIFITKEQVPESVRFILQLNPLSVFVEAYRGLILTNAHPDLGRLFYVAVLSIAVFVTGGLVFRQLKRGFADVL